MLELVAASTIIALALVPALGFTRRSLANLTELERHEQLISLCTTILEEELARTAGSWDLTTRSGDFSSIGRPEIRFSSFKSDAIADGGMPNSLAVVQVTVWYDEDSGNDIDGDEPQTQLATKLAKVLSYEYEATVH